MAVQSHYLATGSVVTWAEPGVGAVATQSEVEPSYGPLGLQLMREGTPAPEALRRLVADDEMAARRQVAMVDAEGRVDVHTGEKCIDFAGHLVGDGFSVQANLMASEAVWPAMMGAYEASEGDLAERLLAAMDAAEAAGGDIRGRQSATILVVRGERAERPGQGKLFDLRVDDHSEPLVELRRLVRLQRAISLLGSADESLAAGDPDAARGKLAKALELSPDDPELKAWVGLTLAGLGDVDEGVGYYDEAARVQPGWRRVVDALVRAEVIPDNPEVNRRLRGEA